MSSIRFAFLAFLVGCMFNTFVSVTAQSKYTNRFDNVNIDQILSNGRILQNYIKCLLDKGPCTNEGRELKKLLPDALATECSKCSEIQKKNSSKVISYLRANKPQEWNKLLEKYDPKGNYLKKYGKHLPS